MTTDLAIYIAAGVQLVGMGVAYGRLRERSRITESQAELDRAERNAELIEIKTALRENATRVEALHHEFWTQKWPAMIEKNSFRLATLEADVREMRSDIAAIRNTQVRGNNGP